METETLLQNQVSTYSLIKQPQEAVIPVERDGVKFYCSADGSKVGLSQSGIARLSGISESSIRALLATVVNPQSDRTVSLPSSLAAFAEQEIYLPLKAGNQEKIVRADIAAAVVEYYAFESPAKNELATHSFRLFARKGMETWIKEIVGYQDLDTVTLSPEASTNEVLLLLVQEVKEMRGQLALTSGYRAVAPEMPGLVQLTNGYQPETTKGLAYAKADDYELYSQTEWVEMMGFKPLNLSELHSMALIVTGLYASMFLTPPEKVLKKNTNGVTVSGVSGYPRRHFPILTLAYQQMQANKAAKKAAKEAKKKKAASRIMLHDPRESAILE